MKKVGKIPGLFRYDLNQIPYGYTVEVRNRFKGLDLIDRVPEELWTEVCDIVQEAGIKTTPKKKKCKKAKWLSEEALQIAVKRTEAKGKGEKERYTHLKADFQRIARRDKKTFLSDQCKKQRKRTEWERQEISSRKLEILRTSAGGCDRCTKHSREELPHVRGQGQKPGGPHALRAVAKRSYPMSEVRGSG